MTDSIQPVNRIITPDESSPTSPAARSASDPASFQRLLAGSVDAGASTAAVRPAPASPGAYVDNGPGGSGAVLQLDTSGRIMCMCPECVAARQAAASTGGPSASAASAGSSSTAQSPVLEMFSTSAITAMRADLLLGRADPMSTTKGPSNAR